MFKILFCLLLLSLTLTTFADTKLSLMGSANFNTSDSDTLNDTDGVDDKGGVGFGVGMRALMGMTDQLFFRSGAGVVYKKYSYDYDTSGGLKGSQDSSFVYLNVPLTLYWKASPQVGFFGGTALQAKLGDDCNSSGNLPSCTNKGAQTLVLPAILGFDFSLTDSFGMELSYEYGLTETAKDLKVQTAVASILYHL
jgi:Outer membrane protein beta-barrel domain